MIWSRTAESQPCLLALLYPSRSAHTASKSQRSPYWDRLKCNRALKSFDVYWSGFQIAFKTVWRNYENKEFKYGPESEFWKPKNLSTWQSNRWVIGIDQQSHQGPADILWLFCTMGSKILTYSTFKYGDSLTVQPMSENTVKLKPVNL